LRRCEDHNSRTNFSASFSSLVSSFVLSLERKPRFVASVGAPLAPTSTLPCSRRRAPFQWASKTQYTVHTSPIALTSDDWRRNVRNSHTRGQQCASHLRGGLFFWLAHSILLGLAGIVLHPAKEATLRFRSLVILVERRLTGSNSGKKQRRE
jgi:hypothetical protein